MSHVPTKATVCDRSHDSIPLNFLMMVKFVTAWNSTGVEVPDRFNVLPDRPDQVSFHDLHMVDVIKQLHVGRIYFLYHAYPPRGVIAHVVRMINLAVEKLQTDDDAVIVRYFLDTIQTGDRIARAFIVRHAAPIPGKRNDIGHSSFGSNRNVRAECLFNASVVPSVVKSARNFATAGVSHRANKSVPTRNLVL